MEAGLTLPGTSGLQEIKALTEWCLAHGERS